MYSKGVTRELGRAYLSPCNELPPSKADHPDQENYLGQRIYFVIAEEYIYLVTQVVEKDWIFLKTIIPSRKATRAYKKEQEVNNT